VRFVKLDHEQEGSWKHMISLRPWSSMWTLWLDVMVSYRLWGYRCMITSCYKVFKRVIHVEWSYIFLVLYSCNLCLLYSFLAHPFYLCSVMIVWLVTREQILFQVMMARHKAGVRASLGKTYLRNKFWNSLNFLLSDFGFTIVLNYLWSIDYLYVVNKF